jgi:hypothetical protein
MTHRIYLRPRLEVLALEVQRLWLQCIALRASWVPRRDVS